MRKLGVYSGWGMAGFQHPPLKILEKEKIWSLGGWGLQ